MFFFFHGVIWVSRRNTKVRLTIDTVPVSSWYLANAITVLKYREKNNNFRKMLVLHRFIKINDSFLCKNIKKSRGWVSCVTFLVYPGNIHINRHPCYLKCVSLFVCIVSLCSAIVVKLMSFVSIFNVVLSFHCPVLLQTFNLQLTRPPLTQSFTHYAENKMSPLLSTPLCFDLINPPV